MSDSKLAVCPVCGGTGKRFVYRSEITRHYCGPCQPCFGTGRVEVLELDTILTKMYPARAAIASAQSVEGE